MSRQPEHAPGTALTRRRFLAGGTALVVGGGNDVAEIRAKFVELAGGPDVKVVLIPTASEVDDFPPEALEGWKRRFGFKDVTLLHTRDRKRADSEEFVRPLREAKAVWFGGGRQWRLVDAYLDTAETLGYYATKTAAQLQMAGQPFGTIKIGAATLKGNTALHDAIAQALSDIEGNGTYAKTIDQWGQSDLSIQK